MTDDDAEPPRRTPTAAALRRVTTENLERLGSGRLAEILVELASTRPELKRRLRMELAAEQGAEQLVPEIDRRLASLATSGGRISWRRRPAFVADLEVLRELIAGRLGALEPIAARERLWRFLSLAATTSRRMRDKDGTLDQVFARAAGNLLGGLAEPDADALAAAVRVSPAEWARWLATAGEGLRQDVAGRALHELRIERSPTPGMALAMRALAERAGDPSAFAETFGAAALKTPAVAAQVAQRWLEAGDVAQARRALDAAATAARRDVEPAWETVRIAVLEAAGEAQDAQAARWALFEATLAPEPLREHLRRLADFDDVEAEERALAFVAAHPDAEDAFAFLLDWPALAMAAQLVRDRVSALDLEPETALLWAGRLAPRHPAAAERLLRHAAALAFRRRQLVASERLTLEADAIGARAEA